MTLAVSIFALIVSLGSFVFAMWSWRQANRPIVIAYVETVKSGDVSTVFNIVVENVGNRPARDVKLSVLPAHLSSVGIADDESVSSIDVRRVFSDRATIPVLKPTSRVTNAFGQLSPGNTSTWKPDTRLKVSISYRGYERRSTYVAEVDLLLSGDGGFAGTFWSV